MARYIDADRLLDDIEITPFEDYGDYETAKSVIQKQPSADVRENVRGEWIHKYTHESLHDRTGIWCSACGKDALQDSEGYYIEDCETDFCPNCGALMKGKKA